MATSTVGCEVVVVVGLVSCVRMGELCARP